MRGPFSGLLLGFLLYTSGLSLGQETFCARSSDIAESWLQHATETEFTGRTTKSSALF